MKFYSRILFFLLFFPLYSHATPVIPYDFLTEKKPQEHLDSVAIWHSPDQHILIVTAKTSHCLHFYDATDGSFLKTIGSRGTLPGQFLRPNGIAIVDDFAFITERDGTRVQVLHLPEGTAVLTFGEELLQKPYGIWAYQNADLSYDLYVTDNLLPLSKAPKKVFWYTLQKNPPSVVLRKVFGDETGPGVLHKVESICGDPENNRLLIADEAKELRNIKVYTLDGIFTGTIVGKGIFMQEPEGIALWRTTKGDGYWICTDQGKKQNFFHVFERKKLKYRGSFEGKEILNTDGIALTEVPMPGFPKGGFYAVDFDRAVAGFCLDKLKKMLGL